MPEILSMIQVNKMTPAPAVLIVVSIGLGVVCLPWLRWKHPEWDRPIKVSLIWPLLYTLATIFITIVPMVASPVETGIGIAIILTGVPVYFIFVWWKNKPKFIQKLSANFTKFMQQMFVVLPPQSLKIDGVVNVYICFEFSI